MAPIVREEDQAKVVRKRKKRYFRRLMEEATVAGSRNSKQELCADMASIMEHTANETAEGLQPVSMH